MQGAQNLGSEAYMFIRRSASRMKRNVADGLFTESLPQEGKLFPTSPAPYARPTSVTTAEE